MDTKKKGYVIFAPHADDELIGCFGLIHSGQVALVIYGTAKDCDEAERCSQGWQFARERFIDENMEDILVTFKNFTFVFPDPFNELHPLHKRFGHLGFELWQRGVDVEFYTTNMNAPYIKEVPNPDEKRHYLNVLYPQKSDLWKYDHKYFLFEGRIKFL